MYIFYLNCVFYFELMYLFNSCSYLLLLNSCIYSIHVFIIFEFMYLLFLKIHVLILLNCFYVFIYYFKSRPTYQVEKN